MGLNNELLNPEPLNLKTSAAYLCQIHLKLQDIPQPMHFRRNQITAQFFEGLSVG